jgi:cell wall-associated NlpC family hydrolase
VGAVAAAVLGCLLPATATAQTAAHATGGVTAAPSGTAGGSATSAAAAPARRARAALAGDRRTALVPAGAPAAVEKAIAAANRITRKPYRWGGGHGRWQDAGYDCSGAVSYVLYHAGLLRTARDSSGLMSYGRRGRGRWITVYAHGGHAYIVIAGLRFDTSGRGEEGPRWRTERRSAAGYVARRPPRL